MNINPVYLILGILAYLLFGALWAFPSKRKLIKKYGADKTNDYFIAMAKAGDKDAQDSVFRARVMLAVGFAGVGVIVYLKYS